MNYFAHALPFLDDPYFLAGTAVPDWLSVVDRRVRVRTRTVEPFCDDPDPVVARVAGGVLQHLDDDARFHATRAFAETSAELARRSRDALDGDGSFRPAFLGHLLTELLLDAVLADGRRDKLTTYYNVLDTVDATVVQRAVSRMATRPTERLAVFIELFRRERILWDYFEDARLMVRLSQVMRRVGFEPLPPEFAAVLPGCRQLVAARADELLEPVPAGREKGK